MDTPIEHFKETASESFCYIIPSEDMVCKIRYWPGALIPKRLLDNHPEIREKVYAALKGELPNGDMEKLIGFDIWSTRINQCDRILLTAHRVGEQKYLLVLEYTKHYRGARFLRDHSVLRAYQENNGAEISSHLLGLKVSCAGITEGELRATDIYRYGEEYITLSTTQTLAVKPKKGLVKLEGAGGTGKTTVAVVMMERYTRKIEEGEKIRILYTTELPSLLGDVEKKFYALYALDKEKVVIDFKPYSELTALECISREASDRIFKTIISSYKPDRGNVSHKNKPKNKATVIDAVSPSRTTKEAIDAIMHEFGNCSLSASLEEYLQLEDSLFKLENHRRWIYGAYQQYLSKLKTMKKRDARFTSLLKEVKYDFIFVDEGQDLTPIQLESLCKLRKGHMVVAMDFNQGGSGLSLDRVLTKANGGTLVECISLEECYRCPEPIVRICNKILETKRQLRGGVETKGLNEVLATREEGSLACIIKPKEEEHADLIKKAQSHTCVIVTLPLHVEEAKVYFNTELVMIPDQVKGFGYETVIAYRLFDNDACAEAYAHLQTKGHINTANLPKEVERGYESLMRDRYVTFSRAEKNLLIVEVQEHPGLNLLTAITSESGKLSKLENIETKASDAEGWKKEAERLALQKETQELANRLALANKERSVREKEAKKQPLDDLGKLLKIKKFEEIFNENNFKELLFKEHPTSTMPCFFEQILTQPDMIFHFRNLLMYNNNYLWKITLDDLTTKLPNKRSRLSVLCETSEGRALFTLLLKNNKIQKALNIRMLEEYSDKEDNSPLTLLLSDVSQLDALKPILTKDKLKFTQPWSTKRCKNTFQTLKGQEWFYTILSNKAIDATHFAEATFRDPEILLLLIKNEIGFAIYNKMIELIPALKIITRDTLVTEVQKCNLLQRLVRSTPGIEFLHSLAEKNPDQSHEFTMKDLCETPILYFEKHMMPILCLFVAPNGAQFMKLLITQNPLLKILPDNVLFHYPQMKVLGREKEYLPLLGTYYFNPENIELFNIFFQAKRSLLDEVVEENFYKLYWWRNGAESLWDTFIREKNKTFIANILHHKPELLLPLNHINLFEFLGSIKPFRVLVEFCPKALMYLFQKKPEILDYLDEEECQKNWDNAIKSSDGCALYALILNQKPALIKQQIFNLRINKKALTQLLLTKNGWSLFKKICTIRSDLYLMKEISADILFTSVQNEYTKEWESPLVTLLQGKAQEDLQQEIFTPIFIKEITLAHLCQSVRSNISTIEFLLEQEKGPLLTKIFQNSSDALHQEILQIKDINVTPVEDMVYIAYIPHKKNRISEQAFIENYLKNSPQNAIKDFIYSPLWIKYWFHVDVFTDQKDPTILRYGTQNCLFKYINNNEAYLNQLCEMLEVNSALINKFHTIAFCELYLYLLFKNSRLLSKFPEKKFRSEIKPDRLMEDATLEGFVQTQQSRELFYRIVSQRKTFSVFGEGDSLWFQLKKKFKQRVFELNPPISSEEGIKLQKVDKEVIKKLVRLYLLVNNQPIVSNINPVDLKISSHTIMEKLIKKVFKAENFAEILFDLQVEDSSNHSLIELIYTDRVFSALFLKRIEENPDYSLRFKVIDLCMTPPSLNTPPIMELLRELDDGIKLIDILIKHNQEFFRELYEFSFKTTHIDNNLDILHLLFKNDPGSITLKTLINKSVIDDLIYSDRGRKFIHSVANAEIGRMNESQRYENYQEYTFSPESWLVMTYVDDTLYPLLRVVIPSLPPIIPPFEKSENLTRLGALVDYKPEIIPKLNIPDNFEFYMEQPAGPSFLLLFYENEMASPILGNRISMNFFNTQEGLKLLTVLFKKPDFIKDFREKITIEDLCTKVNKFSVVEFLAIGAISVLNKILMDKASELEVLKLKKEATYQEAFLCLSYQELLLQHDFLIKVADCYVDNLKVFIPLCLNFFHIDTVLMHCILHPNRLDIFSKEIDLYGPGQSFFEYLISDNKIFLFLDLLQNQQDLNIRDALKKLFYGVFYLNMLIKANKNIQKIELSHFVNTIEPQDICNQKTITWIEKNGVGNMLVKLFSYWKTNGKMKKFIDGLTEEEKQNIHIQTITQSYCQYSEVTPEQGSMFRP